VYDDCTDDLEHLPAQHPLFLVLAALVDDDREPALLIGKHRSIPLDHHRVRNTAVCDFSILRATGDFGQGYKALVGHGFG